MKVHEIRGAFGLENLVPSDRPEPVVGPGQALLEVRAISLNYRDLLTVQGLYNPRQPLPLIPCSDAAAVVLEVGDGVERVAPGDRVMPIFAQRWLAGRPSRDRLRSTLGGPLDGTLQERMVVDAEGLVTIPEHLTDLQAATLPCAGVTAWSALAREGGVTAGDTVLIQGTGGVSIFALQLSGLLGARAIVTSSSDAKLERAEELGAWRTVNYRSQPDWGKKALELTGGEGVDHVVEVGGAGTLAQSLAAVRMGGSISMIGVLAGVQCELALTQVLMKKVRLQGILVGDREDFESLCRAITAGGLRPVVDRAFSFTEARSALAALADGNHFGKLCIQAPDA